MHVAMGAQNEPLLSSLPTCNVLQGGDRQSVEEIRGILEQAAGVNSRAREEEIIAAEVRALHRSRNNARMRR
jgi:hypothetical protein